MIKLVYTLVVVIVFTVSVAGYIKDHLAKNSLDRF